MKKVQVLLSTYNGEKYIKELLDSLLRQQGVDVSVLIRDDGSTDSTLDIIESIEDSRVKVYKGTNLKPAKSFLQLIKDVDYADYYAFCDQDDVWNDDKLIQAVKMMEKEDGDQPVLYMSTYDVVDENLELIFKRDMEFSKPFRLETTIMYRCPSGCTMVFNDKLKELVKLSNPEYLRMHDFWTLMVAEAFKAKIITDERSQLKYRQHGNNTVGYGSSIGIRVSRWIRSALFGKNERQMQAICFYNEYKSMLPDDSKKILKEVVDYRKSIGRRVMLATNKNYRTSSWRINIMFFGSVILGIF